MAGAPEFLGRLVLSAVRATGVVTRYGGEEILVIAPHTPLRTAVLQAERLREYVESRDLAPSLSIAASLL